METNSQSLFSDPKWADLWKMIQATSEQMKETDRQMKETDKEIKELKNLFSTQWGRLVEALCKPSALKLFKDMGIGITHIYEGPRHGYTADEKEIEVDIILCNTTVAMATEVKTTCTVEDIVHFLEQMKRFKSAFHEFSSKTVYVAIAALRFDGCADKYAQKKGMFVIRATGEGVFAVEEPKQRLEF